MLFSKAKALLGTIVEITVISDDPSTLERIECVLDYFWSIEVEFSRFRSDSALSVLNREKIQKVSSRFVTLMRLSQQKHSETKGHFNPLVQVARLGYSQSFDTGTFEQTDTPIDIDFTKVLV